MQTLEKTCARCATAKPVAEFKVVRTTTDGQPTYGWCLTCTRAYARTYNRARRYGVAGDEYAMMVLEQGGLCYVCRQVDDLGLSVDHNHETGAVRKLLCRRCNTAIGMAQESAARLEALVAYLREHEVR